MHGLNSCQENSNAIYRAQFKINFASAVKVIQNPSFVEFSLLTFGVKEKHSLDIIFDTGR